MPSFDLIRQLLVLSVFYLGLLGAAKVLAWDKVDEQLARKVSFEFIDAPLAESIYKIVGDVELDVFIEIDSLTEEGISADEPINRTFENVPAKEALGTILLPLGLAWEKTSETEIRVTTIIDLESEVVRFYDVADLLAADRNSASEFLSALLGASQEYYREKDGGGGTALLRNGLLVIRHSKTAHQEIANSLKTLRKAKNLKPKETDRTPIYKSFVIEEKSQAAFLALQTPVSLDYEVASIETHLAKIAEQAKLEYQVDETDEEQAQEISAILKRNKYPFRSAKMPAVTAIEHLLPNHWLDFSIKAGKLIITDTKAQKSPYLTLCIKIDETTGWDAQSVADIVQDAADKGKWQTIDGEGGTITQPLNDVLLVQNTAPVLYQTLKVLDQLRPQSEMAVTSKRDYFAGIGRRAPNNDWFLLPEADRIVVRSQADQLPEVDEVVCYKLNLPSKEKGESVEKFKEVLHPFGVSRGVRLQGKDAVEIARLWRNLSFQEGWTPLIGLHFPEVGLVFRREGKVVLRTTISLSAGTVLFKYASGKYEMYGVHLDTGPARRLKERLIGHQIFNQTFHEMWKSQSSEPE